MCYTRSRVFLEVRRVSRAMEERHLELADRHIAEGRARIERQADLIKRLRAKGESTARAEEFIRLLESTLAGWQKQRELILAELARR
jgi:hypothetical protein